MLLLVVLAAVAALAVRERIERRKVERDNYRLIVEKHAAETHLESMRLGEEQRKWVADPERYEKSRGGPPKSKKIDPPPKPP
jgi:hypothetical protein